MRDLEKNKLFDYLDLTYLKVEESRENKNIYIISNGEKFLEVPQIAVDVLTLCDGNNSSMEIQEKIKKAYGVDVDVQDFLSTLDKFGILMEVRQNVNIFDKIPAELLRWLHSKYFRYIKVLIMLIAITSLFNISFKDIKLDDIFDISRYSFISLIIFFLLSWTLSIIHEFAHIIVARSYNSHVDVSLGVRLQFLVLQTRFSDIWFLNKKQRYNIYAAGLDSDVVILSIAIILYNLTSNKIWLTVGYIKLFAILWQFLFFMKTDIYYIFCNFFDEKNLMKDSEKYIKNLITKENNSIKVNNKIKMYSVLLVVGRIVSLAYFILYTIPINVVFIKSAVKDFSKGSLYVINLVVTVIIIIVNIILYVIGFIKQRNNK